MKISRKLRKWRFKCLFGIDADHQGRFHIVYGKLLLPEVYDKNGKLLKYPYEKIRTRNYIDKMNFSIQNPISGCELRAAKYITTTFSKYLENDMILIADQDIDDILDISFISFGGIYSNYKTFDALNNESNKLIKMTIDNFISLKSERNLFNKESTYDYGLILKVHPEQFPKRTWIVCAGIGEWGTSGSAWYLSNKWRMFLRANSSLRNPFNPFSVLNKNSFAAIIRIKEGQDESAVLYKFYKNVHEVEQEADKMENNQKIINENQVVKASADSKNQQTNNEYNINPSGISR